MGAPMNDLVVPNQTAIRKAKCRMMRDASYRAPIIGTAGQLARGTMERALYEGLSR